jgi:hypothetical protein
LLVGFSGASVVMADILTGQMKFVSTATGIATLYLKVFSKNIFTHRQQHIYSRWTRMHAIRSR